LSFSIHIDHHLSNTRPIRHVPAVHSKPLGCLFFVFKGLFLMFTIYMKIVKIIRKNPIARFIVKYKRVQHASKPTEKYQEEAG